MRQTPHHQWHVDHHARMVDFAGWDMPIQYTSIVEEHDAVRTRAGLFDIAHMGRLEFRGPGSAAFLDRVVTNDVAKMKPGQIRYALVTNERGGILDDVLVYHLGDFFLMVVNASNREKIVDWIQQHITGTDELEFVDRTFEWTMLAIQGPRAVDILNSTTDGDLSSFKYYSGNETAVYGHRAIVSRTGYTGEDGFEVIVDAELGDAVWSQLSNDGADQGLQATGLGCRDTLRLEAAMPLYGHELNEDIDPLTAGLQFAVKLQASDFVGRQALLDLQEQGLRQARVGLLLDGRRIAREHALVFRGDDQIGEVTSGTFSPTLQRSIAMAYVDADAASLGASVEIDIRGKRAEAVIVELPFYRR